MTNDLEKIDLLRARMGISYKEAKEALEEAGSDVVQALINLEEKSKKLGEKIQDYRSELGDQLRAWWAKGREVRLLLKKEGRTVLQIPAVVGALGIAGAMLRSELALLATLGAVTAMARHYSLEVAWPDQEPGGEQE
ncbi:MAG: DUF4342 domain-containing protein [Armatimonadetes bacterium]|nr:DUF4342 domain-containing protein [Armatimonadota bacterium]